MPRRPSHARSPRSSITASAAALLALAAHAVVFEPVEIPPLDTPAAPATPASPLQARPPARFTWPVPNQGFLHDRPIAEWVQATESGDPSSGLYGCVRNSGTRFHEGVDIQPVARDRRGEATDTVIAAADGVILHIAARAGESGYGRYVVLEHTDLEPAIYTLYAHLAAIAQGLSRGDRITRGTALGTVGRSAGGYSIPRERAHLHFEIGLRLTDDFQAWYNRQGFGSPNLHSVANGLNLAGVDPLAFFRAVRAGEIRQPVDFLRKRPVAATAWVPSRRTPDFALRYPSLVDGPIPAGGPAGWEIDVDGCAVPIVLRPRTSPPPDVRQAGRRHILFHDAAADRAFPCRQVAVTRRGELVPGDDLSGMLDLLFGPG